MGDDVTEGGEEAPLEGGAPEGAASDGDAPDGTDASPDAPDAPDAADAGPDSAADASVFCPSIVCGPPGNSQCEDGGLSTCILDDGGCPAWSAPVTCPAGLVCAVPAGSSTPEPPDTCVQPSCVDGVQDDGETAIDCGGPCPACVDEACTTDQGCATDSCNPQTGTCAPAQCNDGRQDGRETGVDCGGIDSCPRCTPGAHCGFNYDCIPGHVCDPTSHTCM